LYCELKAKNILAAGVLTEACPPQNLSAFYTLVGTDGWGQLRGWMTFSREGGG